LQIDAVVVSPDGLQVVRGASEGRMDQAFIIGATLGEKLLQDGGRRILEQVLG
jgi:porphobilinogen deaminase